MSTGVLTASHHEEEKKKESKPFFTVSFVMPYPVPAVIRRNVAHMGGGRQKL